VILNARQVSNRHCEIELVISAYETLSKFKYDNGKAFIRDISSNGTKINGETIKKNVATEVCFKLNV
jgi:pSer/pThr/pTyr-binding forkhead associated (FHA) protein